MKLFGLRMYHGIFQGTLSPIIVYISTGFSDQALLNDIYTLHLFRITCY
jgi:hypothetical protein